MALPRFPMAVAAATLLLLLTPGPAAAQVCPNPLPLACNQTVNGNSTGAPNEIDYYSGCDIEPWGPEVHYLLTVTDCVDIEITLQPSGFDGTLLVLPWTGSDCSPSGCLAASESGYSGEPEQITGTAAPGELIVTVDGWWGYSYGSYTLSVACTPYTGCVDGDGDGYPGYDASTCPCGNDCADGDAGIHPGATDICGDSIDQDCSGADTSCPPCSAQATRACSDSGSDNINAGTDSLTDYCQQDDNGWGGKERIWSLTSALATAVEVTITNFGSTDLDLFAVRPYGRPDVCNPDDCLAGSVSSSGTEQVTFFAPADEPVFVIVDAYGSTTSRAFDYTVSCLQESCTPGTALGCDASVTGDTRGGTNEISAYPVISWPMLGPETVYTLQAGGDALMTLELAIDPISGTPPDLGLYVLEESGGCAPENLLAYSDLVQDGSHNPVETVTFQAAAGGTYYVLVDGWLPDVGGTYTLTTSCEVTCPSGQTDCSGTCYNLQTDPTHCGSCTTDCASTLQHVQGAPLCSAGHCDYSACAAGYLDCDSNRANGCEQAEDDQHCGTCTTVCTSPFFCFDGGCTDACPGNLTNCSGTCVDTTSDPLHCGSCTTPCQPAHATGTCSASTCGLGACDAGWGNCDGQVANGCEQSLQTDPAHCGACNQACNLPGVDSHTCSPSGCGIGTCDALRGDCNTTASDGCETDLSADTANCGACDQACQPAHGTGACVGGDCTMSACDTGWGDCNSSGLDGCETNLNTDRDHCGDCLTACGATQNCVNGDCEGSCHDNDGDGYEATSCGGDDCNDFDALAHPGGTEICGDGVDQDCNGSDLPCDCVDADGDSYQAIACGGSDCNDADASIHPGATEVCEDGIDQDCNGSDLACGTCQDADGDGHQDSACGGDDCNDGSSFIFPGAQEICGDGVDQDCNGSDLPCGNCQDADGDGHNDLLCGGDDCNDQNAMIHPGVLDDCGDGIDQDCSGSDRACPSEDSGCGCGARAGSPAGLGLLLLGGLWFRRRRRGDS